MVDDVLAKSPVESLTMTIDERILLGKDRLQKDSLAKSNSKGKQPSFTTAKAHQLVQSGMANRETLVALMPKHWVFPALGGGKIQKPAAAKPAPKRGAGKGAEKGKRGKGSGQNPKGKAKAKAREKEARECLKREVDGEHV